MIRVLFFINNISPTSIPLELAVTLATETTTTVTVVSFYDTDGEYNREFIDGSFEVVTLGAKSRFDTKAWSAFWRELHNGEYDILHTHHNFSGSVARVLAVFSDVRIVDTEHRLHSSMTPLQNLTNAVTLPIADRVVSNSYATQASFRWYEQRLMDSKRLSVIHNGVNISRLDVMENHTTNADGIRLLSVGRLVPVKCHKTLFRSFASLIEEFPEASLILVGAGPLREELHTVARELGIIDDVHFTGQISRERVYAEFAKADVFVLTSRAEGFCVAAVEAMAAGLPVVVSDIEVLHEVVGDPGVFADPNSPEDFADAISDLLRQPERRERLGQEAKERAWSKFSLERTAREYSKLYKEEAETLNQ